MWKGAASLVIQEYKLLLQPPGIAIIKKTDSAKCWQRHRETGVLVHCRWDCIIVQPLSKVKHKFMELFSSSTPRYLHKRNENTYSHKGSCVWILLVVLFIITKKWNQPICSLLDKWLNIMWYVHKVKYSSAINRMKYWYILKLGQTWRYTVNKRIQTHNIWYEIFRRGKSLETESKSVVIGLIYMSISED